ncbi:hypothetical protein HG530_010320 [Fusarium avenaceum]|nr:hypothetical protein HG530_010320 [Fusarium avenaceum]
MGPVLLAPCSCNSSHRSTMGIPNARVFPEPVCALPITSPPDTISGIVFCWILVGLRNPGRHVEFFLVCEFIPIGQRAERVPPACRGLLYDFRGLDQLLVLAFVVVGTVLPIQFVLVFVLLLLLLALFLLWFRLPFFRPSLAFILPLRFLALSASLTTASFAGIDIPDLHRVVAKPFKRLIAIYKFLLRVDYVVVLASHQELYSATILDNVHALNDLESSKVLPHRCPSKRCSVDGSARLFCALVLGHGHVRPLECHWLHAGLEGHKLHLFHVRHHEAWECRNALAVDFALGLAAELVPGPEAELVAAVAPVPLCLQFGTFHLELLFDVGRNNVLNRRISGKELADASIIKLEIFVLLLELLLHSVSAFLQFVVQSVSHPVGAFFDSTLNLGLNLVGLLFVLGCLGFSSGDLLFQGLLLLVRNTTRGHLGCFASCRRSRGLLGGLRSSLGCNLRGLGSGLGCFLELLGYLITLRDSGLELSTERLKLLLGTLLLPVDCVEFPASVSQLLLELSNDLRRSGNIGWLRRSGGRLSSLGLLLVPGLIYLLLNALKLGVGLVQALLDLIDTLKGLVLLSYQLLRSVSMLVSSSLCDLLLKLFHLSGVNSSVLGEDTLSALLPSITVFLDLLDLILEERLLSLEGVDFGFQGVNSCLHLLNLFVLLSNLIFKLLVLVPQCHTAFTVDVELVQLFHKVLVGHRCSATLSGLCALLVELEACLIELSLGVFELLLKSLGFLSLEIILNLENLLLSSEGRVTSFHPHHPGHLASAGALRPGQSGPPTAGAEFCSGNLGRVGFGFEGCGFTLEGVVLGSKLLDKLGCLGMLHKLLLIILLSLGSDFSLGTEILLMVTGGFQMPCALLFKSVHLLLQDCLLVLVAACNLALGITTLAKLLDLSVLLLDECFHFLLAKLPELFCLGLGILEVGVGHIQIPLEIRNFDIELLDLILHLLLLFANLDSSGSRSRPRLKSSGSFFSVSHLDCQLVNTSLEMVSTCLDGDVLLTNLAQARHKLVNSLLIGHVALVLDGLLSCKQVVQAVLFLDEILVIPTQPVLNIFPKLLLSLEVGSLIANTIEQALGFDKLFGHLLRSNILLSSGLGQDLTSLLKLMVFILKCNIIVVQHFTSLGLKSYFTVKLHFLVAHILTNSILSVTVIVIFGLELTQGLVESLGLFSCLDTSQRQSLATSDRVSHHRGFVSVHTSLLQESSEHVALRLVAFHGLLDRPCLFNHVLELLLKLLNHIVILFGLVLLSKCLFTFQLIGKFACDA